MNSNKRLLMSTSADLISTIRKGQETRGDESVSGRVKVQLGPDGISFNATATISALDNPLDAIKRERERKIKGENKSGRRYDEMDLERLHFHAMRLASNSTAVRLNCGRGKDATRSKEEQPMMRLPFVLRSLIGRWERWPDIESFQVLPDISRKGKERSDYFERAIITRH